MDGRVTGERRGFAEKALRKREGFKVRAESWTAAGRQQDGAFPSSGQGER